MKKFLLAAALVLFIGDVAYGQTCQAYLNGAKARASKSKWREANEVLGEHVGGCMENAEYRYFYGVTLAQTSPDSMAKSIAELQAADQLNGDPGEADELQAQITQALTALWAPMVNDGIRLLAAGRIPEAEAKLTAAVALNPASKEAQLAMGAVHQAKEEWDPAIERFRAALAIDPAYKTAMLRLGQTYQLKADAMARSGDAAQSGQAPTVAAEAATVYEGYLATNPDDLEVRIQLAGLYATLGDMTKADPIIRSVMAAEGVDAQVLSDFGFALANARQDALAEEVLSRAIVMTDSTWSDPISYLAFVKIRGGDLAASRALLEKQVQLDPANAQAWEYLGLVRRDLGDQEGALEALERGNAIPIVLENAAMSQDSDQTWNVELTFSNRLEQPVNDVRLKVHLVDRGGNVLESQEVTVADEPLAAGQAERVRVEFGNKAADPLIRYEIL